MRFSTFSTGFSTAKGHQPYTHRNSGHSFLVSFGFCVVRLFVITASTCCKTKPGHSAFYKKESRRIFFAFYKPFPSGDLFFSNLEWLAPSFQHRAAAVFLCGKGGETCSFPHRKKQCRAVRRLSGIALLFTSYCGTPAVRSGNTGSGCRHPRWW